VSDDKMLGAWISLPGRIYLDICTLQAIDTYGGVISEDEPFVPKGPAHATEDVERQIQALRMTCFVNERAMFEFVVTPATLQEVNGRNNPRYVRWVNDV